MASYPNLLIVLFVGCICLAELCTAERLRAKTKCSAPITVDSNSFLPECSKRVLVAAGIILETDPSPTLTSCCKWSDQKVTVQCCTPSCRADAGSTQYCICRPMRNKELSTDPVNDPGPTKIICDKEFYYAPVTQVEGLFGVSQCCKKDDHRVKLCCHNNAYNNAYCPNPLEYSSDCSATNYTIIGTEYKEKN